MHAKYKVFATPTNAEAKSDSQTLPHLGGDVPRRLSITIPSTAQHKANRGVHKRSWSNISKTSHNYTDTKVPDDNHINITSRQEASTTVTHQQTSTNDQHKPHNKRHHQLSCRKRILYQCDAWLYKRRTQVILLVCLGTLQIGMDSLYIVVAIRFLMITIKFYKH